MSKEETLLQGNAYENFINAIKTQATHELYIFALRKFMSYLQVQHVNDLLGSDPKLIEARIISWMVHLKKSGLSYITINRYLAGVMFFYIMNDVLLNKYKIKKYLPPHQKQNEDRGYTREEIAQLLQFSDERSRALILLLASTGMRIGAVPDLKIKHLRKIPQHGIYRIIVYAGWTDDEYICFTTPEATKAIDTYLEYRRRYGEKLELDADAPLFREQFDNTDLFAIRHPKQASKKFLAELLRRTS
jgi:site-specific recombinase XerD